MDGLSCNSQGRSLSLVIPAYNEEAGIQQAIEEADQALAKLVGDYEILIVDDGSADRTAEIVREAIISYPNVRLLQHAKNQGYSAALRTGFQAAIYERVAFTDADCQFHLADLEQLLSLSDEHQIAVGYRLDRQDPWQRRFFSRGYNFLVRTLLGTAVRDCDCALKVFQRDALIKLLPEMPGFFVNTEILTRARQLGFSVAETGVRHRPRLRGRSSVSLSDIPRTLSTLLPFWWMRVMFPGRDQKVPIAGLGFKPWYLDLGFWTVFIVAVVLFFGRMRTPLLEPDEARYAEIPRQMLNEGSWIVPVLHGQPYCHKPPLLYWLVMGSYEIFGVEDWAARLVPSAACFLLVLVTYGWGRQVNRRAALISALILCLSSRFLYFGRMLTMDGLLSLWVVSALAMVHIALRGPTLRWLFWLLSALCCGLGLLTKGPIALVLVTIPVLAWQVLDWRTVRAGLGSWLVYVTVTIGVALPWYAAVAWQVPEFVREFLWTHHILRFLAPIDHAEPFWFFLPGLALGMFPWALLFIPLTKYLLKKTGPAARRRPASMGFFLLAGFWCLLFFSLGGCKRPSYILPAIPLLALALGSYADVMRFRARRIGFENLPVSWVVSGATTFVILFFAVQQLLPVYAKKFSMRAQVRPQRLLSDDQQIPVVCFPHGWDSVSFYLRRNDVQVYSSVRRDGMIKDLRSRPQTLVFVKSEGFVRELRRALPPSLEFVPLGKQGNVTAGIVQQRMEASPAAFARH
jgi:dolichol-phosphate mannosyltransferase